MELKIASCIIERSRFLDFESSNPDFWIQLVESCNQPKATGWIKQCWIQTAATILLELQVQVRLVMTYYILLNPTNLMQFFLETRVLNLQQIPYKSISFCLEMLRFAHQVLICWFFLNYSILSISSQNRTGNLHLHSDRLAKSTYLSYTILALVAKT